MPGPLVVVGKRKWTDLESRLAASLVYRFMRGAGPLTRDEIETGTGLSTEEVLHAISWMRGRGVNLRVHMGNRLAELPSRMELIL